MKKIKITTIILAIILVALVAFVGVYIKTQNRMENKVRDYSLGRELSGERIVEINVSTNEETKPQEEDMNIDNYETVKKTIEERLKGFGAQDYEISLNNENGTIVVRLPEDENTDTYAYLLTADAKVQIKEKDSNTELLSDSMVKKALYTYTADAQNAYQVYLELYLTEEGQTKIEEIKNNYAVLADEIEEIEATEKEKTTEEDKATTEDATKNETATQTEDTKKIAQLTIAGNEYGIAQIEKGKIRVAIGSQTSNSINLNNSIAVAAELATLISSGKYPITYEIGENRFVYSDITKEQMNYYVIVVGIVMLIVFIVFTINYKTKGLLASISFIGFISILSLILRYTNVSISIEGFGAILLTMIINVRINQLMLRDGNNIDYKQLALNLAPVVIITLVFSFARWAKLSSFGMVMFWGLTLIVVYNISVTKTLLKLKESK